MGSWQRDDTVVTRHGEWREVASRNSKLFVLGTTEPMWVQFNKSDDARMAFLALG